MDLGLSLKEENSIFNGMKFFSIYVIYFNHNLAQDVELSSEAPMLVGHLHKAIDIRAYVLE